jgi:hypothetical protein
LAVAGRLYVIEGKFVNDLISYLESKPYKEVAGGIALLSNLNPLEQTPALPEKTEGQTNAS